MKKIFRILVMIMACILLATGCGNKKTNEEKSTKKETETKTEITLEETDYSASCVKKKGSRYVIVLPVSGYIIPIGNTQVKYLSYVSDELVLAAEEKITAETGALGEEPRWSIEIGEENELRLNVEIIKYIDNEDPDAVGCGIDHEHIYFSESITVN